MSRQAHFVDIWRSLRLVRAKPGHFLLGAILGFILVLVGPTLATKPTQVFRSTAKILITPNTSSLSDAGQRAVDPSVRTWFTDENTIRALLSSQDLLDVVLESAGSKISWLELRERIQLDILSNSGQAVSLLELSVLGGKPDEVRVLTQILSDKFIQYVQQLSAAEHDKTVAFLERERRNAEREVARAQKRLLKIGIVPASAGGGGVEEAWVKLQEQRNSLEEKATMAQARIEEMQIANAHHTDFRETTEGQGASLLDQRLAAEQLKLEELRETYQDRSDQVKKQMERLAHVKEVRAREIFERTSAGLAAAQGTYRHYKELLAENQARLKELDAKRPGPEKHLQYVTEERQLSMWQDSYLDLTKQLYRARVLQQSARRDGAFTIVERPQVGRLVAGQIINQSLLMRIAYAIPAGILMGLALVVGSDYLTSSMRLEPRIEEALSLPIIGNIPNISEEVSASWDIMKQNVRRPQSTV